MAETAMKDKYTRVNRPGHLLSICKTITKISIVKSPSCRLRFYGSKYYKEGNYGLPAMAT